MINLQSSKMLNYADVSNFQFPYLARYLLVVFAVLVVVLSLVGNVTVLVASIKYHAIKFDKVSVILIQNIAAVDIAFVVLIIIPTIWTIPSDQNVVKEFFDNSTFGKVLCFTVAHFQFWSVTATTTMISALNISKLMCLLSPLQASVRSARAGYFIVVFAWFPYLIRFIAVLAVRDNVRYGSWNDIFRCLVAPTKFTLYLDVVLAILTTMLPAAIIAATTLWLIYFARRTFGLQKQSIIVNILISTTFILAFLPYSAFIIWKGIGFSSETKTASDLLWVASGQFHYLLTFANPIIYYFSSASFKQFVDSCCVVLYRAVHHCCAQDRVSQQ